MKGICGTIPAYSQRNPQTDEIFSIEARDTRFYRLGAHYYVLL